MAYRFAILATVAVSAFAGSAVGTFLANGSQAEAASSAAQSTAPPRWGSPRCRIYNDRTCYTVWNWCVFLRHFNVGQVDDLGVSGLLRNWKLTCR